MRRQTANVPSCSNENVVEWAQERLVHKGGQQTLAAAAARGVLVYVQSPVHEL